MTTTFTLFAAPRTKKTSNRTFDIGRRCPRCHRGTRTIVMPSEAYERYEAAAVPGLRKWLAGRPPIAEAVSIAAAFYVDADRRVDVHALCQGLADVLVVAGVLADDNRKIIRDWDGTRVHVDRDRPRVEVTITHVDHYPTPAQLGLA